MLKKIIIIYNACIIYKYVYICICNPCIICIEFCNHAVHQYSEIRKTKQNPDFWSETPTAQSRTLMSVRKVTWTWESHSTSSNSTLLIWKINIIKLLHLLFLVNYCQGTSDRYGGIIV